MICFYYSEQIVSFGQAIFLSDPSLDDEETAPKSARSWIPMEDDKI